MTLRAAGYRGRAAGQERPVPPRDGLCARPDAAPGVGGGPQAGLGCAFLSSSLAVLVGHPTGSQTLEDMGENHMVRHECAEALGSIAVDEVWNVAAGVDLQRHLTRLACGLQCLPVLHKYATDGAQVVKESCLVALDMHEVYSPAVCLGCAAWPLTVACAAVRKLDAVPVRRRLAARCD
jgi:hypothetical protein